jgi:leucyl/phenylalanyl-tRNA--protein transferase
VHDWWQRAKSPFNPERADENGLVAVGGALDPDLLLVAYRSGVFPWSSQPMITWWSPDPRAIFDLASYKPHRSVRQSARHNGWRFSVDEAFEPVMRACAAPAPGRESTWIGEDFIAAYCQLHQRGFAHSIEVWEDLGPSGAAGGAERSEKEELVGGLYGVTLGGFFGGESMFNRRSDASKAAVMFLVERLRACNFTLCDAQVPTPHLERLGATSIARKDYLERLARAIATPARLT